MLARLLLFAAAVLAAPGALACAIVVVGFETSFWHRLIDHRPPEPAVVVEGPLDLKRGIGPRSVEGRPGHHYSTSCDDIGYFAVEIEPGRDERTDREQLGYAFEVIEGEAPAGLFGRGPVGLPSAGLTPAQGERHLLSFWWADGATNEQEALDFTFVIRTVDRGGNKSAPSAPITIEHAGYEAGDHRGR